MPFFKARTFKSGVLFVVGSRAEVIKIQPVITDLNLRSVEPNILWAGLHTSTALAILDSEINLTFLHDDSNSDKKNKQEVISWFGKSILRLSKMAMEVRFSGNKPKVVVVHGDTLCTLLGTFFGVLASVPVAHIEACVRSGSLFRPFPEEISRRIVSRFASINFVPGNREYDMASKYSGERVNTIHNTSRDALYRKLLKEVYFDEGDVLVTLHRTELLSRKDVVEETIHEIIKLTRMHRVVWYMGEHERHALTKLNLINIIDSSAILLKARTSHAEFIERVAVAHCVITDSHGLQYECQDLGVPVVVHRRETEYLGNDDSAWVLTGWNAKLISDFIFKLSDNPKSQRGARYPSLASSIIANRLTELLNQ